jgi:hypothetical protein
MKRILIAAAVGAVAMGMAAPAMAQDANGGGWGCSVGGGLDQAFSNTKFTKTGTAGGFGTTIGVRSTAVYGAQSPDGVGYALHLNCDHTSGNWVFGAQIQHASGLSGKNVVTAVPTWTIKNSINSVESFTGRAGYMVSPDLLAYVRGGAAVAFNKYNVTAGSVQQETAAARNIGFVLGTGVEWSINKDWSLFGDFSHIEFGSYPNNFTAAPGSGATPDIVRVRQSINQLTFGINYHF